MLTDHLLVICFLVVVQFHLPSTYYKNIEIWSEVFESRTVDNDNLARMFEIAYCQESITRSMQLPFHPVYSAFLQTDPFLRLFLREEDQVLSA